MRFKNTLCIYIYTIFALDIGKILTLKQIGIMQLNINTPYIQCMIRKEFTGTDVNMEGYPHVNEYTGNPDLFPQTNQLTLF
jgi:hypothetical protein